MRLIRYSGDHCINLDAAVQVQDAGGKVSGLFWVGVNGNERLAWVEIPEPYATEIRAEITQVPPAPPAPPVVKARMA